MSLGSSVRHSLMNYRNSTHKFCFIESYDYAMADLVFPGKGAGAVLNSTAMPKSYDLEIYKGDYVEMLMTLKDSTGAVMDLTGYTATARIRSNFSSTDYFGFNVTIPNPELGKVRLYMPTSTSTTLEPGTYIWGFQVTNPNGDSRTYLAGDVTVYDEVT
jgi:hypothetical protein